MKECTISLNDIYEQIDTNNNYGNDNEYDFPEDFNKKLRIKDNITKVLNNIDKNGFCKDNHFWSKFKLSKDEWLDLQYEEEEDLNGL